IHDSSLQERDTLTLSNAPTTNRTDVRMEPARFSDFVVTVGGSASEPKQAYHLHRAILATRSKHFGALIENGDALVHFPDGLAVSMDAAFMTPFVELLYNPSESGAECLTKKNLQAICRLGRYFDCDVVLDVCEQRLMKWSREGVEHNLRVGDHVMAEWKSG